MSPSANGSSSLSGNPDESLIEAFGKDFPPIGLPGGVSPFLDDDQPEAPPANVKPVTPPEGVSSFAPPSSLIQPPSVPGLLPPTGDPSHMPQPDPLPIPGMLPAVGSAPGSSSIESFDSISNLSLAGMAGDDPFISPPAPAQTPATAPAPAPQAARTPQGISPLERLHSITLTGTDHFQGRMVDAYLGLIEAQVIITMESLFTGDVPQGKFGRFKLAQSRMKQTTQLLLLELQHEALKHGANAVLRVSVQKIPLGNTLAFCATGTAVRLAAA